jgi:hypothetical protein
MDNLWRMGIPLVDAVHFCDGCHYLRFNRIHADYRAMSRMRASGFDEGRRRSWSTDRVYLQSL